MSNGLPSKAKVGIPGKTVEIDPATYFLAKRMETAGMLQPGHALMLAATLRKPSRTAKKGKRKSAPCFADILPASSRAKAMNAAQTKWGRLQRSSAVALRYLLAR